MNSEGEIKKPEKSNEQENAFHLNSYTKISDPDRLKFTNEEIVVRYALSESMNDHVEKNQTEILQSQIIQKPKDDSFEEWEDKDMFRSQKMVGSSSEIKKMSSGMKKMPSLNMPVLLHRITSKEIIGQIKEVSQNQQSKVKINMENSSQEKQSSPILQGFKKKKSNDCSDTSILFDEKHQKDQKQVKEVKNQRITKNQSLATIDIQKKFEESISITKWKKNSQLYEHLQYVIEIPQSISLPPKKPSHRQPLDVSMMEVNEIVPCIFSGPKPTVSKITQLKNSQKKQEQKQFKNSNLSSKTSKDKKEMEESIIIAHNLHQEVKDEQNDITKKLMNKIESLQTKIRALEEEREEKQEEDDKIKQKLNRYCSTPTKELKDSMQKSSPQYGSIRKNQQPKNYASSETNQTSNMFRMRIVPKVTIPTNRLTSNVFNIALSEQGSNDDLRSEIELLKNKINSLQSGQSFHNQGSESSKSNQKYISPFQPSRQSPDRKQLKGRIVRRFGSRVSKGESQNFRKMTEESGDLVPTPKGFTRNQIKNDQKLLFEEQEEKQDRNEEQQQIERKRVDSSAIFKRNPKNQSTQTKKQDPNYNYSKFPKTLQFNMQHEKFVVLDSRDTSTLLVNNQKSEENPSIKAQEELPRIQIPEFALVPTPDHHSEELIQIGKITFQKLGCQITDQTVLNVKKFKNCVLFSISNEFNILWHYEGKFYFGGWKTQGNDEGQKTGEGIEYVPGKYRFKGIFSEGKRNGFGILIMDNGTVYIGQWANGYKHGQGKQIDDEGFIYIGQWSTGKRNGCGKIFHQGNLLFNGIFSKGLKDGPGEQYFENGDQYEGQYKQGKFHGKGEYKWNTGARFKGEFVNGERCGKGIWQSADINGDLYEGEYKEDKKHGFGIYRWSNGSVYEGSFKNDLKHGEGTIKYNNGKIAHLCWKNGEVIKKVQLTNRSQPGAKQPKSVSSAHQNIQARRPSGRSVQNLQSARSTASGQRALPKGIKIKSKVEPQRMSTGEAALKMKLGPQFERNKIVQKVPPRDAPYRGMQTTTNINMNI